MNAAIKKQHQTLREFTQFLETAWRVSVPKGITPAQGNVLAALYNKPLRSKDLSKAVGCTPANLVLIIKNLVWKEWVTTHKGKDKRTTYMELTKAGRKAARSVFEAQESYIAELGDIPQQVQDIMDQLCSE